MNLTHHARQRFAERYGGHDINGELSASLPFGGQKGGSALRISPCGAVFVISENGESIVTVLTREQAYANMQFTLGLKATPDPLPIAAPDTSERERRFEAAVIDMARKHADADDACGCKFKTSRRARAKEISETLGDMRDGDYAVYRKAYFERRAFLSEQWAMGR